MLRIRRIYSTVLPRDKEQLEQVKEIFLRNFGGLPDYPDKMVQMLNEPFKFGFHAAMLISEGDLGKVTGFSFVLHFPEVNCSMLDFIVVRGTRRSGGLGGALYEATREYCVGIKSRGLYMELAPDNPDVVKDAALLAQNRARLRFYERYGVRPIIGTEYETPISEWPAPCLAFDGLGRKEPLGRQEARAAVRLMLKRKYSHVVDEAYINRVAASFVDDPVRFREPKYVRKEEQVEMPVRAGRLEKGFAVVSSEAHTIHHVRETGYVERPVRVSALRESVLKTGLFEVLEPKHFGEEHITEVHDRDFVTYLKTVCKNLDDRRSVYPYVFPIRRPERKPKELAIRAGYYCIDTFTPLSQNAYDAARAAVDVAMTAAEALKSGRRVAYALCRPPGHHAEKRVFGGFCYFNNAATAANWLSKSGRVGLLDIDFHHCNGTQDIFYKRRDVLTVSIHGHPNYAYPYFSGFADEHGDGEGKGFNCNLPLPEGAGENEYIEAFRRAERLIARFKPTWLVVSLGFDTMKGDPTGAFTLTAGAIMRLGWHIGKLGYPTLVVQEGGYSIANLKQGGGAFFVGIAKAIAGEGVKGREPSDRKQ